MTVRPARDHPPLKDTAADASQEPGSRTPKRADGPARRRLRLAVSGAVVLVVAAAASITGYVIAGHSAPGGGGLRPSGIPASISDSTAALMNLDALPNSPAPGFTFTDQAGRIMSLSDFRGKAVVLEFLDPHCTDICPIVSQEFVDAYRDLGPAAGNVVFIGINVNPYHTAVADVLAFSAEQQLTTIPDWHYFTGPVKQLQPVWHGYHIYVQAPSPSADVVHTSAVYFIDPEGRERYLASPQVDHTKSGGSYLPADQITTWGHGIAALARNLTRLPGRAPSRSAGTGVIARTFRTVTAVMARARMTLPPGPDPGLAPGPPGRLSRQLRCTTPRRVLWRRWPAGGSCRLALPRRSSPRARRGRGPRERSDRSAGRRPARR